MAVMQALMVPLMMATVAVVVGSQIVGVGLEIGSLLAVVPLYVAFLLVMVPLGLLAAPGRVGCGDANTRRSDRHGPLRPVPPLIVRTEPCRQLA
jgi:hypothetical protein